MVTIYHTLTDLIGYDAAFEAMLSHVTTDEYRPLDGVFSYTHLWSTAHEPLAGTLD